MLKHSSCESKHRHPSTSIATTNPALANGGLEACSSDKSAPVSSSSSSEQASSSADHGWVWKAKKRKASYGPPSRTWASHIVPSHEGGRIAGTWAQIGSHYSVFDFSKIYNPLQILQNYITTVVPNDGCNTSNRHVIQRLWKVPNTGTVAPPTAISHMGRS
jgi:hypothetical protein